MVHLWRFFAAVACVGAVPTAVVDLDAVPEARWGNVSRTFNQELRPMFDRWVDVVYTTLTDEERGDWLGSILITSKDFRDYYRELVGIVGWFMKPDDNPQWMMNMLILFNAIYELGSPNTPGGLVPNTTGGCSGLLMADKQGNVLHGRNMDYNFQFQMPDGRWLDLPDVTYIAEYWKDGKVLMTVPSFLFYTGVHTGMRTNGWTFEQNTRHTNERHRNLLTMQNGKGDLFGWRARLIMETTPTFKEAVQKFTDLNFMAPQYFIMSGPGRYEGVVITKDRGDEKLEDTPEVRSLSEENGTWYLLQTNDDWNKFPADTRRPLTKLALSTEDQSQVEQDFVWKNIRSPTLVNPFTVFTWVANPKTGYSKLIARGETESPSELEKASEVRQAVQRISGMTGTAGHTKWARRALLALESGFASP